ncbi:hypothetical protein QJ857_gp0559 [Tupanvirus soda lake]|uniref:Uncharacterized protein n=1 Tax=Tupanvirus deep ocean TaxID=2126984 RepID=A0AC59HC07_9VIRU|nr:hypothetical protein QJ857_gp0559 [Tupanvirus soda lake]AUL78304.2 hypothetical protein [Tupanvirus soda lake]
MDNSFTNSDDLYCEELLALNAVLYNFQQISINGPSNLKHIFDNISNSNCYIPARSLLYSCETDEYVEFYEGKPSFFYKYYIIVVIGSSKSMNDPMGVVPYDFKENICHFEYCNFYLDYFKINPFDVKLIKCENNSCSIESNKINNPWCQNCCGIFDATKFVKMINSEMKFCEMPRNSVLSIGKEIKYIDFNDTNSLTKVKNFLENDKKKIDSIQNRINNADERMKKIIEVIQTEKKFNQEKINKLLSIRGGSMEEYCKTINEVDSMLLSLKKIENNIN